MSSTPATSDGGEPSPVPAPPASSAAAPAPAAPARTSSTTNGAGGAGWPSACERETRARELLGDASDTESNVSRPASPPPGGLAAKAYTKRRLGGAQSRDGLVVRHDSADLALTRELSPYDATGAGVAAVAATGVSAPGGLAATSGSAVAASPATSTSSSRASSPPPRAMSPPLKAQAQIKLNGRNDTLRDVPHEAKAAAAPPASAEAAAAATPTPPATASPAPEKAAKEKDNRGMLRRMLSGGESHSRSSVPSPTRRGEPVRSASSRGSTPPGSPRSEGVEGSLMHAVQGMQLNAATPGPGSVGPSPNSSAAPSRNTSVKSTSRTAHAAGKAGEGATSPSAAAAAAADGTRLTAAALRDWEATGAKPVEDKKKKKKDGDAKSSASSTLRDMIMGSAPLLNRRGSNTSQAGRSEGKEGSRKGSESGRETASLLKKYGVCEKAAIGKGATAVVRLAHKWDRSTEKLYAVKEFRKRRKNETEKEYVKKLTSEFCISSTLHHINIVETVDLVQDENHHWCEVMEYCPGGDLYAAIKRGGMSQTEVECCFKQLLHGISYLHSMGVAHRDIKPENLLLDANGQIKITDFGVSDVFRMCWEKSTHYSKGLCGSEPYIAPEQFEHKEYDARLVDVWAAAVVFYCMQFQELPWRVAKMSDPTFKEFVHGYHGSAAPAPLSNLSPRDCRPLLKKMLCPDPKGRWSTEEVLKDPWLMSVGVCEAGVAADGHRHHIVTPNSS